MKIVNQVDDNILGNIFCVAQEDGRLKGWAKKIVLNEENQIFMKFIHYSINKI